MITTKCPDCNRIIYIDESQEYAFCSYCGTKMKITDMVHASESVNHPETKKDRALKELQRLYDHFSPVAGKFDELDYYNSEINRLNGKNYGILTFFSVLIIVSGVCLWLMGSTINLSMPGMLIAAFGGVMLILALIISMINISKIDSFQKKSRKALKKAKKHYIKYTDCPLGIEYCRPGKIRKLIECIESGRADSIKEALNIVSAEQNSDEMKSLVEESVDIAEASMWLTWMHILGLWKNE